jgi:hypothetical protein
MQGRSRRLATTTREADGTKYYEYVFVCTDDILGLRRSSGTGDESIDRTRLP